MVAGLTRRPPLVVGSPPPPSSRSPETLSSPRGTLLAHRGGMRKPGRGVVLALLVSFLALGLAVYGARVSPADAPPPRTVSPTLAAARYFVLLPEGRVEITDAWSRRVFKWDGRKWDALESRSLPRPDTR